MVHGHPQFAMQALLQRIGVVRDAVALLGAPAAHGREAVTSEALRPAAASDLWQERLTSGAFAAQADAAFKSIIAIEAGNAEEEALAIAVALREAMETPGKTAALVTPDRALARRVLAALARWNVPVDDSGGDALSDTPAGVFARLVAEAALEGLAPVTLLALLKHRDMRPRPQRGRGAGARGAARAAAEAGQCGACASARDLSATSWRNSGATSRHRCTVPIPTALTDAELDAAAALVERLKAALAPLEALPNRPATFRRHRNVPRAGAAKPGRHGRCAGRSDSTTSRAPASIEIAPADYPELFHAAIAETVVRRPEQNVRVRIFGPLEARLQSVDRLVLGGLVEGVWPPETRADPWLSRPMRHELGLDLPERRIGLSAHDFAQALGAPEVILTRAARQAGRADGRLALRAAARRGGGRGALEGGDRARRAISRAGAQAR